MWTIGHSTRSLDAFAALLTAHGIARVVDVRRFPRSRRHPHFDHDALSAALARAGIEYAHRPGLGGRRRPRPDSINTGWQNAGFRGYADHMPTPEFGENIQVLIEEAERAAVAIMCAEAVPWRCHRSLIADVLVARGVPVHHILSEARAEPHALTPWARLDGGHVTYPGLLGAAGG